MYTNVLEVEHQSGIIKLIMAGFLRLRDPAPHRRYINYYKINYAHAHSAILIT